MNHADGTTLTALLNGIRTHLQNGQSDKAERLCTALIIRAPASADGLMMGAVVHQLRGDLTGAVLRLERALAVRPDYAEAWGNRASAWSALGSIDRALADSAVALSLTPSLATVYALRARHLYGRGEHRHAAAAARRALALGQSHTALHVLLVDSLRRESLLEEAEAVCRGMLERSPHRADLWVLLGLILTNAEDDAAVEAFGRAVLLEPAHPTALNNRGHALLRLGRPTIAVTMLRAASVVDPRLSGTSHALAWRQIGDNAQAAGDWFGALRAFEAAVRVQPTNPELWERFAIAAATIGQQNRGEMALRIALAIAPATSSTMTNFATLLVNEGRIEGAVHLLHRSLAVNPDSYKAHSNLLFAHQYQTDMTPAEHRAAHRAWYDQHGASLAPQPRPLFTNDRDPERRLRVGIVSADLKRHPVGYFLAPFLTHHDRSRMAVFCYANQPDEDAMTRVLRGHTEGWRRIDTLSDEALVEMIRADSIDILIDLSGHTAEHRLLAFARRPAPVQVTWLGYVHTTGMPVIDGIIGGGLEIPIKASSWFEERLLALPHGRFCYQPPAEAPPVAPPPSLNGKSVTFGSFNTLAKLSDPTIALWARVLAAVPDARLILKARPLCDPIVRNRIRARFAAVGIKSERLDLRGWSPHAAMLSEYADIDIGLDPRPFSGGLTSCEALWMGVPMVTWPGDTPASRQSAHFLALLGLPDLVARSAKEYVEIAVALSRCPKRLAGLRAGMREQMTRSPLLDGPGFTRTLEETLRAEWRCWCGSNTVP